MKKILIILFLFFILISCSSNEGKNDLDKKDELLIISSYEYESGLKLVNFETWKSKVYLEDWSHKYLEAWEWFVYKNNEFIFDWVKLLDIYYSYKIENWITLVAFSDAEFKIYYEDWSAEFVKNGNIFTFEGSEFIVVTFNDLSTKIFFKDGTSVSAQDWYMFTYLGEDFVFEWWEIFTRSHKLVNLDRLESFRDPWVYFRDMYYSKWLIFDPSEYEWTPDVDVPYSIQACLRTYFIEDIKLFLSNLYMPLVNSELEKLYLSGHDINSSSVKSIIWDSLCDESVCLDVIDFTYKFIFWIYNELEFLDFFNKIKQNTFSNYVNSWFFDQEIYQYLYMRDYILWLEMNDEYCFDLYYKFKNNNYNIDE